MAIGTPTNLSTTASTTTVTTASFTPANGSILLAMVGGRRSNVVSVQPTISDSLGGTWTELDDVSYDPGANPRIRARLFYQEIVTGASMTVTGTITDATTTMLSVIELTGAGTNFSNRATATHATGDPSVTLAAMDAASAGFSLAMLNATNLVTPQSGYTELFDLSMNSTMRIHAQYDLSSPGTTLGCTSTNTVSIIFGLEIKEPGGTDATGNGGTVTETLSVVAGAASAASSAGAATLTVTLSLTAGVASAEQFANGATVVETLSLIAGAWAANAATSADLVTQTLSVLSGGATADSEVAGQTVPFSFSIIGGTAESGATAEGDLLTTTSSFLAGDVEAGSTVGGAILPMALSLVAGSASGAIDATATGDLFILTSSLLAGTAANDNAAASEDVLSRIRRGRR